MGLHKKLEIANLAKDQAIARQVKDLVLTLALLKNVYITFC